MIGKILTGIFKLIISLVNVILSPIDTLINNALPDVASGINAFNSLINYVINFMAYVVDASGLSSTAINLIILYFTFTLTLPLSVYTIKLAMKWYDKLKP